jgi:hypothetical protein
MDQSIDYRTLIKELLTDQAALLTSTTGDELDTHTIFDEQHNRYMVFRIGWLGKERIQTPYLYLHLRNGKIWIEEDYTEDGIATALLAAGVPHQDIVLAFRHPQLRSLTEFAIA